MLKKITVYFLCALVLALSLASLHAHLPLRSPELSLVHSSLTTLAAPCHLCWAQANFNSDNSSALLAATVVFPASFLAIRAASSPLSVFIVYSISPRAPPA